MKLSIYSLKKVLYDGDAESVNCKTANGEITVLDNHKPLISMLGAGVMKIIDKKKEEHYINVSSGFLEIKNNIARGIVEDANAN